MVEQDFIDRFKNVLATLTQQRGEVSVFALFKMDDLTDKWSVILSAPWVSDDNRSDIFLQLRTLLVENLEKEDLQIIARLGVFSLHEHLIELLMDSFKTGDYIAQDRQINGNLIHEGYILSLNNASNPS